LHLKFVKHCNYKMIQVNFPSKEELFYFIIGPLLKLDETNQPGKMMIDNNDIAKNIITFICNWNIEIDNFNVVENVLKPVVHYLKNFNELNE